MNRRTLFGVGGSALLPLSLLAQAAELPEELEERLAELEERVTTIEQRLDELMGDGESPPDDDEGSQPLAISGDVISFSGRGTTLTEAVSMKAGPYRVTALVTVDNGFGDFVNVVVAGSNAWDDDIFYEFFEGNGEYEVSTDWSAARDGEYAFQIDCMSQWELTFEAM